jgi:hypothetical protein
MYPLLANESSFEELCFDEINFHNFLRRIWTQSPLVTKAKLFHQTSMHLKWIFFPVILRIKKKNTFSRCIDYSNKYLWKYDKNIHSVVDLERRRPTQMKSRAAFMQTWLNKGQNFKIFSIILIILFQNGGFRGSRRASRAAG